MIRGNQRSRQLRAVGGQAWKVRRPEPQVGAEFLAR